MERSNILIYKPRLWRILLFYALILGMCGFYVVDQHWHWKAVARASVLLGIFLLPFLIGWNVRRIVINLDTRIIHFDSRSIFMPRVFEFPLDEVNVEITGRYVSQFVRSVKLIVSHNDKRELTISNGFTGWHRKTLRKIYEKVKELKSMKNEE